MRQTNSPRKFSFTYLKHYLNINLRISNKLLVNRNTTEQKLRNSCVVVLLRLVVLFQDCAVTFLPAATKLGQGNKFTGVCLSTRGGGGLPEGGVVCPGGWVFCQGGWSAWWGGLPGGSLRGVPPKKFKGGAPPFFFFNLFFVVDFFGIYFQTTASPPPRTMHSRYVSY